MTVPASVAVEKPGATTILCETRCHLGEGSAYDAATDTAFWFDILERRLFEAHLGTQDLSIHALPVMASALAAIDDERQLVSAQDGLYLRTRSDGRMILLHAVGADNAATRSNDARAHSSGSFWFSTMGRKAETAAGAIYALHDGAVHRLFGAITIPNAICFSPDGAFGFFADTRLNVLHRVALDTATGLPVGEPQVLRHHPDGGGLDGAVVDRDGLLWIARWGGGSVDAFTPDGDRVRSVAVPARQPSCPVFVGRDFDRLLVTTAHEGMSEDERRADAHHGHTVLLDIGAIGRPEPRVRLGAA